MILSCCFLSIGYASIANINLSLTGTAQLDKQTGIVISSVVLDNYSGVDPDLSEINTYYQTMLDSKTVLGNDPTSYITYHVTVTNLSNKEKRFFIYPNDGFRLQLQDFDRVLKYCNYDLEKYRQIHKRLFEKKIDE